MLHNPAFRYNPTPVVVGPTYHPAITEYATRIAGRGGSINTADLNALNTFVSAMVTQGLLANNLTSGESNSDCTLREIYPFAGNDILAAEVKLIYRGAVGELLARVNMSNPSYTRAGGISPGDNASGSRYNTGNQIQGGTQNMHVAWWKEVNAGARSWGTVNGSSFCQSINTALALNIESSTIATDRVGEPATGFICVTNNAGDHRIFNDGVQVSQVTRTVAASTMSDFAIFNSTGSVARPSTSQRITYMSIGFREMPAAAQAGYYTAVNTLRAAIRN